MVWEELADWQPPEKIQFIQKGFSSLRKVLIRALYGWGALKEGCYFWGCDSSRRCMSKCDALCWYKLSILLFCQEALLKVVLEEAVAGPMWEGQPYHAALGKKTWETGADAIEVLWHTLTSQILFLPMISRPVELLARARSLTSLWKRCHRRASGCDRYPIREARLACAGSNKDCLCSHGRECPESPPPTAGCLAVG